MLCFESFNESCFIPFHSCGESIVLVMSLDMEVAEAVYEYTLAREVRL